MNGDIASTADVCFDCWQSAKSRTEAEQAVLDAMAAIPLWALERTVADNQQSNHALPACRAELARRAVKP